MNPTIKAQWVAALRSGDYDQGTSYLHSIDRGEFCCLGVLCDLAVEAGVVTTKSIDNGGDHVTRYVGASHQDGSHERLPKAVWQWAGLDNHDPYLTWEDSDYDERTDEISELNDGQGFEFYRLADMIEEQL